MLDLHARAAAMAAHPSTYGKKNQMTAHLVLPVHLPGSNRDWVVYDGKATITPDGEIIIVLEREPGGRMYDMAKKGILLQLCFDYRMADDELAQINGQGKTFDELQAEARVTYDEQTLQKVHDALSGATLGDGCVVTSQEAIELISAMQNAGILFRERKSDG